VRAPDLVATPAFMQSSEGGIRLAGRQGLGQGLDVQWQAAFALEVAQDASDFGLQCLLGVV